MCTLSLSNVPIGKVRFTQVYTYVYRNHTLHVYKKNTKVNKYIILVGILLFYDLCKCNYILGKVLYVQYTSSPYGFIFIDFVMSYAVTSLGKVQ